MFLNSDLVSSDSPSISILSFPKIPDQEILLGLVGHLKVQIFTIAADILDDIEQVRGVGMTQSEKVQARNHRLRVAALRGDQEAIDKIVEESVREATQSNDA